MKMKNLFFTLLMLLGIATVPAMAQETPSATSDSETLVLTLMKTIPSVIGRTDKTKLRNQPSSLMMRWQRWLILLDGSQTLLLSIG